METPTDIITFTIRKRKLYLLIGVFIVLAVLFAVGVGAYLFLSQGIAIKNYLTEVNTPFSTVSSQVSDIKKSFDENMDSLNFTELAGDPKQLLNDTQQARSNLPKNLSSQTESLHTMLQEYYSTSTNLLTVISDVQGYSVLSTGFISTINTSVSTNGTDISTPEGISKIADNIRTALDTIQDDLEAIRTYSSTFEGANNFISASRPVVIVIYSSAESLSENYRLLAAAMDAGDQKGISDAQAAIQQALDEINDIKQQNASTAASARNNLMEYLDSTLTALDLLQLQINAEIQQLGN